MKPRVLPTIMDPGRCTRTAGPNVDAKGVITTREGMIAGTEYSAYPDDGRVKQNITMMVQVPASLNPANAQHFDAFLGFPGYAERLVPLHRYFTQAMDMLYANLKTGAALPASQVVRTVPRGLTGAVANPIAASNVPPIKTTPAAADQITFANDVVTVAD
ncbi:hypothetical protein BH10PSE16_BH10PSE16_28940 [soil metagenome]